MTYSSQNSIKAERANCAKIDSNGWFTSPSSAGPFLFKKCWLELTELGPKKIRGLEQGDLVQAGVFYDSFGGFIIHLQYKNLYFKSTELIGYSFVVCKQPSKLEEILLGMFNSWIGPFSPWPIY
jgi:hypothetical protein